MDSLGIIIILFFWLRMRESVELSPRHALMKRGVLGGFRGLQVGRDIR